MTTTDLGLPSGLAGVPTDAEPQKAKDFSPTRKSGGVRAAVTTWC